MVAGLFRAILLCLQELSAHSQSPNVVTSKVAVQIQRRPAVSLWLLTVRRRNDEMEAARRRTLSKARLALS
ncbi:hypothetical protein BKA62DRAFT_32958 [Auriculariales sp. MPI-PUGE-AT-0066]|nr:hypothetical protein BKA62DRAFT_32958 [Auriculariales sp. MPI-PUGE-AT-0066]